MAEAPSLATSTSEPAGYLLGVQRFKAVYAPLRARREKFALAVALRTDEIMAPQMTRVRQPINLNYRYNQIVQTQATGEPVTIRIDRDAGPGQVEPGIPVQAVPGDTDLSDSLETLGQRLLYETDSESETNGVISEITSYGVSCWGIGYHTEGVSLEELHGAAAGTQQAIIETAKGDLSAHRGQDHAATAAMLRDTVAAQPLSVPDQRIAALQAKAQVQDKAGAQEAKRHADPRNLTRRIWMRRLTVGLDYGWEADVSDVKDARSHWRRIVMPLEQFKQWALIKQSARSKIKGRAMGRWVSATDSGGSEPSYNKAEAHDPAQLWVEVFEFWIKRPFDPALAVRKYVCPELPDEWIEESERSPFVDLRTGKTTIPGGIPFYPCAPILSPIPGPDRPFGTPPIEAGYETSMLVNELFACVVEMAKRHSFRFWVLSPKLKGKNKIKRALVEGINGYAFDAPDGVTEPEEMKNLIIPLQFSGGGDQKVQELLNSAIELWRIQMGVPAAVLMGQAMAETARQEEIGVGQGTAELAGVIARIEQVHSEAVRGIFGIVRALCQNGGYIEQIRAMVGDEHAKRVMAWLQTSSAGDMIVSRFGPRAKAATAVEKKQAVEAIQVVRSTVEPLTKLPYLDDLPYVRDLLKKNGMGEPKKYPEVVMAAQRALVMAQQFAQQMQAQEQGGKPGDDGKPKGGGGTPDRNGKPTSGPSHKPPNDANEDVAARRGTVGV